MIRKSSVLRTCMVYALLVGVCGLNEGARQCLKLRGEDRWGLKKATSGEGQASTW